MEKTISLGLNASTDRHPPAQKDNAVSTELLSKTSHASNDPTFAAPTPATASFMLPGSSAPVERFSWEVMLWCVAGGAVMGVIISGALPQGVVIDGFVYRMILAVIGATAGTVVGSVVSWTKSQ